MLIRGPFNLTRFKGAKHMFTSTQYSFMELAKSYTESAMKATSDYTAQMTLANQRAAKSMSALTKDAGLQDTIQPFQDAMEDFVKTCSDTASKFAKFMK
jgi:hypothetical protein